MRFNNVIVVFLGLIAFYAKNSEVKTSQSGFLLLMSDPRGFHIEVNEYCLCFVWLCIISAPRMQYIRHYFALAGLKIIRDECSK